MLRWKIIGETILFLIYALTGLSMGWMLSLRETSLARFVSMASMTCAFILLWGVSRLKREAFFYLNMKTVHDGALVGAIISIPIAARHYAADRVIVHPGIDWLFIAGAGIIIGVLCSKLGRARRSRNRMD